MIWFLKLRLLGPFGLLLMIGSSGFWSASALGGETNLLPAVALPDDTLYFSGRYVYQRNCLTCHGARGDGKGDMAAEMFPKPRPFTSGIFKYRSTPAGFLPTNEDLVRTVREGISGTSMPAFSQLSEHELRAVTEYIKFFSARWRKPTLYALPLTPPKTPGWLADGRMAADRIMRGKELFVASCAPCHGNSGAGDGPSSASLMDDWNHPCRPADLRTPNTRIGRTFTALHRVLLTGIDGTPMPSFAESLSEEQRWEVVAYIVSLRSESQAKTDAGTIPK